MGRQKSCGKSPIGCLGAFGILVLIVIAISMLVLALCILAGIGLWFLIRFLWRRLVMRSPDSGIVKMGMKLPSVARKILAGFFCFFVSCCLFAAVVPTDQQVQSNPQQSVSQENESREESQTTASSQPELSNMVVTFIDVGQGDSELIKLPDGKVMLIDAGGSSADSVIAALRLADVNKIDYFIWSNASEENPDITKAVVNDFPIGEVWASNAAQNSDALTECVNALNGKGVSVNRAEKGSEIISEDQGYAVDVLAPPVENQQADANNSSAIVKVSYGDTSFLFTGAASAEEIVDANPGHVDVLKAGRFGAASATNDAVLAETTPNYVMICCGEGNDDGTPDQATLDAISKTSAKVYSTASNGSVVVTSDGQQVTVSAQKQGAVVAGIANSAGAAESQASSDEAPSAGADSSVQSETSSMGNTESGQQPSDAQQQASNNQQQSPSSEESSSTQQSDKSDEMVVITPNGSKYHLPGCRTLSRSKSLTEMTRAQAEAKGYKPCNVCNP